MHCIVTWSELELTVNIPPAEPELESEPDPGSVQVSTATTDLTISCHIQ